MRKHDEPLPDRPPASILRPRFSVATLMLGMVVFSALGAAIFYGLQAVDVGFSFEGMLVVLTLLVPPFLLMSLKLGQVVLERLNRPHGRNAHDPNSPDEGQHR